MNQEIRVLLVDDEEPFVLNLSRLLANRGFIVTTALNGLEALAAFRNTSAFDVVVLDVKMPAMDGIATLKEIKKLAPGTEVIMLTGHASLTSGIQAMREGAYDYLMKPCNLEDLIAKIRGAYAVESIKRRPVLWRRNRVAEITCHAFTKLAPEDSLAKALELFQRETGDLAAGTLFVLDRENRLQGFVTRGDLIQAARALCPEFSLTWSGLCENAQWLPPQRLDQVMHPNTVTTGPEERLSDVAHTMITHKFSSMPVVQGGQVVGIVRLQDIFLHVEHEIE
ncbi:MAG: response regulator [Desulfobacterales bacterium]|nr:MAG: response regulator [Desulfobacterales bacterium]